MRSTDGVARSTTTTTMAFLYDAESRTPTTDAEFARTVWLISWDTGPWFVPDLMPGGTVFLVDTRRQTIVWETRVVRSCAVPYEGVAELRSEVERRWGIPITIDTMVPSGFCIGWQAEPVRRLDRRRIYPPGRARPSDDELALTGAQWTADASAVFREAWQLDDDAPEVVGRQIGWFEGGRGRVGQ